MPIYDHDRWPTMTESRLYRYIIAESGEPLPDLICKQEELIPGRWRCRFYYNLQKPEQYSRSCPRLSDLELEQYEAQGVRVRRQ